MINLEACMPPPPPPKTLAEIVAEIAADPQVIATRKQWAELLNEKYRQIHDAASANGLTWSGSSPTSE